MGNDLSDAIMDKYLYMNDEEVEVVKVSWETWGEVCDFIKLPWGENGIHGIYHEDGVEVDNSTDRMGLLIPQGDETIIALDGDYLVRTSSNRYHTVNRFIFGCYYTKI